MTKQVYGIMPACMTIWNKDQSYNQKGMEKYVTWLLDKGAHGLSICGTTGENIAMSMEEQKRIIEGIVKFIGGQVPVYAGTGRYSTLQTIELSEHAQKVGADGIMVILPYYLKPHKKAVLDHFRELKKHIDIDIMVYNNPWFAGYELNAREIKELFDEGIIGSVKAAQGDANRIHDLKFTCGDNLKVFYGHDYDAMEAFLARADGWLSGLPAILPKFCRTLYDICVVEKNVDKANNYWYKVLPLIDYFITYTNGYPHWQEVCKCVLNLQGLDAGVPRKPLGEVNDVEKKKIDKIIKDIADIL